MSLHKLLSELMDAPDSTGAGGSGELGIEDAIELLGEEDDKEEVLDLSDKEGKEKASESDSDKDDKDELEGKDKEDEDEELKEIEEELEEPDEEKLELVTPVRRREILKKYPTLFKDFPYLEKAYYREQQFTELLPTIDDAREAVTKSQALDKFEKDLLSGDFSTVLTEIKKGDENSFNKIVDNYLPNLMKVDERAYYHVLGNVIKDTIITMVREAQSLGENGDPLKNAATILNQFVFGTSKFTPAQKLAKTEEKNEQDESIKQREQALAQEKFESVRDDLQTRADNVLRATIQANIDPKKSMSDYVRKNAERDAFQMLEDAVMKDSRFRQLLDKLWERSYQEDYSIASKDRIKSAYLSKCKTLLPSVIKKARNEALKGMGKRVRSEESNETDRKGPINVGRSTSSSNSGKGKEIPKGMKTLDYLMSD